MVPQYSTDEILFNCPSCYTTIEGTDDDCLILRGDIKAKEVANKFDKLVQNLAHDPTNQKVRRQCPDCGYMYMVQAFIGEQETVVYKCDCESKRE